MALILTSTRSRCFRMKVYHVSLTNTLTKWKWQSKSVVESVLFGDWYRDNETALTKCRWENRKTIPSALPKIRHIYQDWVVCDQIHASNSDTFQRFPSRKTCLSCLQERASVWKWIWLDENRNHLPRTTIFLYDCRLLETFIYNYVKCINFYLIIEYMIRLTQQ